MKAILFSALGGGPMPGQSNPYFFSFCGTGIIASHAGIFGMSGTWLL
ncbi:MAG TPA: hypothetical protein VK735_39965 [Pseudonocardia sp.]|nr:hypothetical protein [Pseudonocardia sp.]HTF53661.1 hypothetical protein [Pseudonocardia sp.]